MDARGSSGKQAAIPTILAPVPCLHEFYAGTNICNVCTALCLCACVSES